MKPEMLLFMGGAGSGKGTFAHLLMKQKKYDYIEAGAILRSLPTDSVIGQKITHGDLINDDEIFPIIKEHITTNKDIILDGFPRTLGQAQWLIENYADKFNVRVIFLDINEAKMIAHIKNRIKEGGNRADDNDENAVHKRLESFKNITVPAIQWLSHQNNVKFYDIVLPSDDIETNFNHILKTIK